KTKGGVGGSGLTHFLRSRSGIFAVITATENFISAIKEFYRALDAGFAGKVLSRMLAKGIFPGGKTRGPETNPSTRNGLHLWENASGRSKPQEPVPGLIHFGVPCPSATFTHRKPTWLLAVRTSPLPRVPTM